MKKSGLSLSSEWIARPYGRKKILSDDGKVTHMVVVIEPGRNTGKGAAPELLDNFGLVGHPGIFYEHIENEGYDDGTTESRPTLKYVSRALHKADQPLELIFSKGSSFYSVGTDEAKQGYFHTLENIGTKPIQLRIRAVKSS